MRSLSGSPLAISAQYKRRYYRPQPAIVEMVDVPVETVELTPTSNSAETLADHETRLQVLESFVKVLQEHIQQPPVPHITVQPSNICTAQCRVSADLG